MRIFRYAFIPTLKKPNILTYTEFSTYDAKIPIGLYCQQFSKMRLPTIQ